MASKQLPRSAATGRSQVSWDLGGVPSPLWQSVKHVVPWSIVLLCSLALSPWEADQTTNTPRWPRNGWNLEIIILWKIARRGDNQVTLCNILYSITVLHHLHLQETSQDLSVYDCMLLLDYLGLLLITAFYSIRFHSNLCLTFSNFHSLMSAVYLCKRTLCPLWVLIDWLLTIILSYIGSSYLSD